jgi:hypothetical protein
MKADNWCDINEENFGSCGDCKKSPEECKSYHIERLEAKLETEEKALDKLAHQYDYITEMIHAKYSEVCDFCPIHMTTCPRGLECFNSIKAWALEEGE